ncbi:TlpA family protein disulfide reductase [Pleionea sediminis]|uniref:TlpA family protein disulfide reductase n=1 Tax=Pleionea sediminis TaxID=2569479 RepID=UPI001184BF46|nr:TlpA disulfide reductase family protein [Pleionea sediminis]
MSLLRVLLFTSLFLSMESVSADITVGQAPYDNIGRGGDGKKIKVTDYTGKVVIITFWATWCSPCMKELPILSAIQKQVGTENLQVIAISYQEGIKLFKKVSKTLSDNPMIFSFDRNGYIAKMYGVKAIPHMVIVGRDGNVFSEHIGYNEKNLPSLVNEINSLLQANDS